MGIKYEKWSCYRCVKLACTTVSEPRDAEGAEGAICTGYLSIHWCLQLSNWRGRFGAVTYGRGD